MKKIHRLIELLSLFQDKKIYTTKELSEHFSVSTRTIIRDMQTLNEMGVSIYSTTGPYGGYQVLQPPPLPNIPLTLEEATGLLIAYEMLEVYPNNPFTNVHIDTITKIRTTLPADMIAKIEALKKRILLYTPTRNIKIPYFQSVLQASINKQLIDIEYESTSSRSKRTIYPYGIFLANGLYYCGCYCYKRKDHISLRLDRFISVSISDASFEKPEDMSIQVWKNKDNSTKEEKLLLKVYLTKRGCKLLDSHPQLGDYLKIKKDESGEINLPITREEIDWFGTIFLTLKTEAKVLSPREMIEWLKIQATSIQQLYS